MFPPLMKSVSSGIGFNEKVDIDSSVIIASLLEKEPRHGEAMQIWDAVITGGDAAIMPYSVFVMAKEHETELVTFDDEMMKKFQTP